MGQIVDLVVGVLITAIGWAFLMFLAYVTKWWADYAGPLGPYLKQGFSEMEPLIAVVGMSIFAIIVAVVLGNILKTRRLARWGL